MVAKLSSSVKAAISTVSLAAVFYGVKRKKDKEGVNEIFEEKLQKESHKVETLPESKEALCSQNINSINQAIELIKKWKIVNGCPGVVAGVSIKGKTIWVKGFGYSDIENGVRCHTDTTMRIASISKSMTALILMKLVEENRIELDKPISKYLTPEQFPDKYWNGKKVDITLRQLASHLGGIRHYKVEEKKEENKADKEQGKNKKSDREKIGEFDSKEYYLKERFKSVIDSLKLFKDDPLVAEPGTKYVYTTFGYTLISAVMETVLNGTSFEKHLIKVLRSDLGMKNTHLDEFEPIILNRSSYYFKLSDRLYNCPYVDNSYKWAGGGLLSTIPDLLKFGNIMLYSLKGSNSEGLQGFLKEVPNSDHFYLF